jgi:DNA-directed RNA polymerase specialized sigma24 family protein|tara:strand:+ start:832 stop:1206 length:375 start_codon:yes stop_codon:yes gene_type:complete
MSYLSGAIWRSFNSSTSPYHTIYREKGRTHSLKEGFDHGEYDSEYDFERDRITEEIEGILTDMEVDTIETWFQSTLFKMYIQTGNYSEIARKTKIPRTSISHAVNEARDYIQQTLKERGIEWNY